MKNKRKRMDIFQAAQYGNIEQIKYLLNSGVDINTRHEKYESTALMWAAQFSGTVSSIDILKFLLDKGADINLQSKNGYTALAMAVQRSESTSSFETVKFLLESGADINLTCSQKVSILTEAKSGKIANILLEYGADPFCKSIYGNSIVYDCSSDVADVLYKEIWNKLYYQDMRLAKQYSKQYSEQFTEKKSEENLEVKFPVLPRDVWEIILLNKRKQELCSDLSNNKNIELLKCFAITLKIPISNFMTKAEIGGLISRYLAYGKYYSQEARNFVNKRLGKDIMNIIQMAQRYDINIDQSVKDILIDLSRTIFLL